MKNQVTIYRNPFNHSMGIEGKAEILDILGETIFMVIAKILLSGKETIRVIQKIDLS